MSLVVDIKKDYGKFKLRVQFEAETGVSGLLGASGCGKSLTLKAIAGIERPDSGRILLNGRTLFDSARGIALPSQERGTGYLFQSYALFPNMTAAQNIGVGVRNRSQRKHVTAELLRAFRLEDVAQKYPRQLSGGQQQRVALARILAGEPDVLLLDEPFSALDSYLKGNVYRELQNVLDRFSGVTLLVTHNREEVRTFCDQVCVLSHGKSQSMQSVQDLFAAPDTVAACQLTGCENIVPARKHENGWISVPDWGTELRCWKPLSGEVTAVGIKGQDFFLVDGPGENRLYCRVLSEVKSGFSVKVTGEIPGYGSILYAELARSRWPYQEQPEGIWLQVRPEHIIPLLDG